MGRREVTQFVEDSDCVLILGAFMTDINLGIYTANLDLSKCIYATSEQLRIHHHHYRGVSLGDYLQQLITLHPPTSRRPIPAELQYQPVPFELQASAPITISRMIARVNQQLDEGAIVIADIGDSLFAATELVARDRTEFLSPAYYTSMGFAIPAALGAQAANPDERVLVITGDGAFQMTGMELSTVVRRGYSPIIIVLDNHGYGTERILHPGDWKFNEIHPWNYAALPQLLNGGTGYLVTTEGEFEEALASAWEDRSGFSLIQVKLAVDDSSLTLRRLAERLGERIQGH
jgi:indolepyruvate decarboxylase